MKTFSSFASRGSTILRAGCGIISMVSLTLVVVSAQAEQPQQKVCLNIISPKIYTCSDDCAIRLNQCLVARKTPSLCYYQYNICLSGCTN